MSENNWWEQFQSNNSTINNSFVLFVRLQSPPQVSVGEIQQQGADWHHGALWSREIHSDEYSGRLQVRCGVVRHLCRFLNSLNSLTVLGWRNVISRDEGECFCSYLSTCSGLNRFLMALSVIIGTLKEHDLRLVTNLTKLRPVSSRTQQVLALWLMAVMLGLPTGNSEGHKGRRGQLLETVSEPTTHPWALWGGGTRAQ